LEFCPEVWRKKVGMLRNDEGRNKNSRVSYYWISNCENSADWKGGGEGGADRTDYLGNGELG